MIGSTSTGSGSGSGSGGGFDNFFEGALLGAMVPLPLTCQETLSIALGAPWAAPALRSQEIHRIGHTPDQMLGFLTARNCRNPRTNAQREDTRHPSSASACLPACEKTAALSWSTYL